MCLSFNIQVIDFKNTNIRATHSINEDGSYTIFVNSRFTREQQECSFFHEIDHIKNNDLNNDYLEADRIEYDRHEMG